MSFAKYVTIWCDAIGCQNFSEHGSRFITESRMSAKAGGWVRMHGMDWCPDHVPSKNKFQPLPSAEEQ